MFVDLARAGLGDRLGVVDFDHLVTTDMLLTPVTDTPPSSRTTAKTAINQLVPRGATSIGGGIEAARTAFAAGGGGTARKVLVLVTDGIENQPPFVKGGTPADPRVDLTLYTGITMYTVGLGLGVHVDLGVLTSLATTFRGAFYLTEDRWLSLPKFFVGLLRPDRRVRHAGSEFELTGPVPFEIDVPIGREDTGFTFTLFWQNRQLPLDFQLVSAAETKIDPTIAGSHPEVRYGGGSGYAFYRAALPLATSLRGAWDIVWKLIVSAPLAAGQQRIRHHGAGLVQPRHRVRDAARQRRDRRISGVRRAVTESGSRSRPVASSSSSTRPPSAAAIFWRPCSREKG